MNFHVLSTKGKCGIFLYQVDFTVFSSLFTKRLTKHISKTMMGTFHFGKGQEKTPCVFCYCIVSLSLLCYAKDDCILNFHFLIYTYRSKMCYSRLCIGLRIFESPVLDNKKCCCTCRGQTHLKPLST